MKLVVFGILFLLSNFAWSDWITKCSTVTRLQSWAAGSDRYGVKLWLKDNPESCSGFWVEHEAENKEFVYSTVLASLMSKHSVCIQFRHEDEKQDGSCKLNFIYINAQ